MPIGFGGPGVTPSLGALVTNALTLGTGSCWIVPSGRWSLKPGQYTTFQEYDPITGVWRTPGAGSTDAFMESSFSDGTNYRLANQTGCPVAAIVTTAGSGYTAATPPTWTMGAGGAVFKSVVGGAISTTISVVTGGSSYTYPPTVLISAPPPGGVPATAHCTLSAGAVNAVTVDNQGAGYLTPPTVTFVNDPREANPAVATITTGNGATGVTTLTGAGTVTAALCLDHGLGGQASVPSMTISSGSAAATAIMCWSITAITVSTTTNGSGYAAPIIIGGVDAVITGSALTNPAIQVGLVKERFATIYASAVSGTGISPASVVIRDGGIYQQSPTLYTQGAFPQGAGAVAATVTATMGGQTDTSYVIQT